MNFYPDRDQPTYLDYQHHRVSKAWVRMGTRERTIYKVWERNGNVWRAFDELFETADSAKEFIKTLESGK